MTSFVEKVARVAKQEAHSLFQHEEVEELCYFLTFFRVCVSGVFLFLFGRVCDVLVACCLVGFPDGKYSSFRGETPV